MNFDKLKNLDLSSIMDSTDMEQFSNMLNNLNNNKKKINPNEINNLLATLTSNMTLQETTKNTVDIKDMSESEKEKYRKELKQKLKNKQNIFKQSRTNKTVIKNKINESNDIKQDYLDDTNVSNINDNINDITNKVMHDQIIDTESIDDFLL